MTDQAPLFTVITATYNCGPLIDRTAESLEGQTLQDFQWIVIDGASTDDTVTRIQRSPSRIDRWLSEPDRGIADAWNKGLRLARGMHVLFLNAGDTYDSGFLAAVADVADGRRIVCSHARLCTEKGVIVGQVSAEPHRLSRAMHLPHNWCAVPRSHYDNDKLGSYTLLPQAMDFDWFHRYFLIHGAQGFIVMDACYGNYHLGGTSDLNYVASYRIKERIVVENGANPVVARILRWAYTANHALRRARN